MRLGIEDEFILGTVARHLENAILGTLSASTHGRVGLGHTHRRMYQIRVLQDLGEQETFLHIFKRSSVRNIDIRYLREPLTDPGRRVDGYKGFPRPILVHRVALSPVSRAAFPPTTTTTSAMEALPVIL